jgi:thiaminase
MKSLLDDCVAQLTSASDRFPWDDRRAYADWTAQTYYYVRHSTRLLAAAAARFAYDERGNALHHRFAAHMAEEKKHELLCIHDLKQLGTSLETLREHHSTRAFYEPQYFKIEHGAPIALFGYILPLEAIGPACGRRIIERVVAAHGEKSASFLKLHSEEDVEHLDKALSMLEGLPPSERGLVEENLRQTTYGYVAMLQDIRRQLDVTPEVLTG